MKNSYFFLSLLCISSVILPMEGQSEQCQLDADSYDLCEDAPTVIITTAVQQEQSLGAAGGGLVASCVKQLFVDIPYNLIISPLFSYSVCYAKRSLFNLFTQKVLAIAGSALASGVADSMVSVIGLGGPAQLVVTLGAHAILMRNQLDLAGITAPCIIVGDAFYNRAVICGSTLFLFKNFARLSEQRRNELFGLIMGKLAKGVIASYSLTDWLKLFS